MNLRGIGLLLGIGWLIITFAPCAASDLPRDPAQMTPASPSSPCDDGRAGDKTIWEIPEMIQVSPPLAGPAGFDFLTTWISTEGLVGVAQRKVERWLGAETVEFGAEELRLQKEYGGRLLTVTYSAHGSTSERGMRAEYPLRRPWAIRSESRERGDSSLELWSEITFW